MTSYTVTPNISYGADGQEFVDYDNGFVDSSNYRQQVREAFNRDNSLADNLYYERPDGSIGHRYADLDGDVYQTYEQDFVEDLDAEEYLAGADITHEDAEYLTSLVGGEQAYEDMLLWAAMNMPQSFQDGFDAVLHSSDVGDIQEVIEALYEAWTNNRTDDDEYIVYDNSYDEDEADDDDYTPQEIDVTPEFLQAIEDNYPDYLSATEWAAQFLDDSDITQFDAIIDYGSLQQKAEAIDQLMEMYRTHN